MEKHNVVVKGILKKGDKYLAVMKWYDDRIMDPFQWEFIDGKVMFGESPEHAVLRLIEEYTGMCAMVDKVLYVWNYMLGDTSNIGIAYLCETTDDDIELSEELQEYKWLSVDEFEKYISNRRMLDDISSALNK